MRPVLALPLLAAALPASAQNDRYGAAGTEPFWALTIERGTMRLEQPGIRPITVHAPAARPSFNGRRYVAPTMTIDITRTPCSDGMSDRRYPETVTVTVGRRTYRGCGPTGGTVQAGRDRLADTRWTVAAVDGRPLRAGERSTVNFTHDRVEGKVCNRYGGSYRFVGGRLTTSGIVSTRMACQGPLQRVENTLLAVLNARSTVRFLGRDRIELRGARGSVTLTAAH